ncbi:hypothetical protein H4582DRAFT_2056610 [Lactarius indigo]|nr:hypothetical protein H4582DRAFT_2056610 [Lactarius indigo]
MPPRARRVHATGPGPAMGPTLPLPAPLPVIQQQPFIPPLLLFQPSHAGAYPVLGGNGQYHAAGMDVNVPIYVQPYGAQPYGVQPYGMHPYGAPLAYPPFHPHFLSYPGASNAQPQPWGYGHYPHDQPPNPVLHPVATRLDEWAHAATAPGVEVAERDGRTATSTHEDSSKSALVQQKKSYPNKEVSKGVWQFRVEVDRDQVRQTFAAQTDMTWPDFEAKALERFNARKDRWESDLGVSHLPIGLESGRCHCVRKDTRGADMRSDNGNKRCVYRDTYYAVNTPKPPGCGGHKDIKHGKMMLWAKLIKPRGAGARVAPEVHIAINITPTPGAGGLQNSYVVSGTQVQPGSGLGPSYATQISNITVHTETPASTPMESESPSPPAYSSLEFHTNLFNFGYNDVIQLFELDESLLLGFGLGTENACHVHCFIRDKFFKPLRLMVTSEVPPSTEVVTPTAPAVQDIMERSDGVEGWAIKKEERDVLTIPGEVIDISEGEDEIEEAEDKEIEEEEEEIDEWRRLTRMRLMSLRAKKVT